MGHYHLGQFLDFWNFVAVRARLTSLGDVDSWWTLIDSSYIESGLIRRKTKTVLERTVRLWTHEGNSSFSCTKHHHNITRQLEKSYQLTLSLMHVLDPERTICLALIRTPAIPYRITPRRDGSRYRGAIVSSDGLRKSHTDWALAEEMGQRSSSSVLWSIRFIAELRNQDTPFVDEWAAYKLIYSERKGLRNLEIDLNHIYEILSRIN